MKQLKLALVGCGDRGSCYMHYLDDHPDKFKLVAIADPLPEKTRINVDEGFQLMEYDRFFLIMSGTDMLYILPKEGFSEAELEIVRKTKKQ